MDRLKQILVAYDGSPHSKNALEWAIDLGLLTKAKITAVKVAEMADIIPYFQSGGDTGMIAEIEEHKEMDRRILDAAALVAQSRGVAMTTELLFGNIALAILEYAKENDMDLIVAGTRGHGVLEGMLMGSVTRNLISLSKIPVLVVKD
jgi:nucleotide-binding universal stress UspA family protein